MRAPLKPLLHLLALALAVPQVLLCTAFVLLDHVTARRTLGSFFLRTLDLLNALFGWAGVVLLVATLLLIAGGFSTRYRQLASGVVILVVVGTTIGLFALAGSFELDQLFIFIPGLFGIALSALVLKLDTVPA
jgi:hypothetical protein